MVAKEGNTYMKKKPNVVKEAITPPIAKNKIDKVNKKRNHKHTLKQYLHPEAISTTRLNH